MKIFAATGRVPNLAQALGIPDPQATPIDILVTAARKADLPDILDRYGITSISPKNFKVETLSWAVPDGLYGLGLLDMDTPGVYAARTWQEQYESNVLRLHPPPGPEDIAPFPKPPGPPLPQASPGPHPTLGHA